MTDKQREALRQAFIAKGYPENHTAGELADIAMPVLQATLSQQPVGEEELIKALKSARGTLEYLRVQSIEEHAGFSNVVFLNAKQAVVNIDKLLARFNISDRGK